MASGTVARVLAVGPERTPVGHYKVHCRAVFTRPDGSQFFTSFSRAYGTVDRWPLATDVDNMGLYDAGWQDGYTAGHSAGVREAQQARKDASQKHTHPCPCCGAPRPGQRA